MDELEKVLSVIADNSNIGKPNIIIKETTSSGYIGISRTILIEETEPGCKPLSLHLFLKTAPLESRQFIPLREIFLNEIRMYEEILPEFFKFQNEYNVPDPFDSVAKYYGSSKADRNEFLIFEDLNESGFVLWDKTKPMTTKIVEFILKESAKYHAFSFAMRDQKPELFNELSGKVPENFFSNYLKCVPSILVMLKSNAEKALKCFHPIDEKTIYDILENFIENQLESVALDPIPDKLVIIQGDSWCNNYMFIFEDPTNPDEVKQMKFLDWQFSRLSSPVIDLSYFFYCNGPQEAFDNLNYYLKVYHDALTAASKEMGADIEKIFPFSELQNHWKKYARFGFIMACTILNICGDTSDTEITNISQLNGETKSFTTAFVKSTFETNKILRTRVKRMVRHFVENDLLQ